ncbi:odorant receptor 47a-like [Odontomachus brunneus]|uniref:odorant receptor 47a-like n=1 Tax=Odontomachus brunneus TaxID=486640 RepID=UPI0013F27D3E|nr:odorant receptor 47a-like [Odontomachus brunneus]
MAKERWNRRTMESKNDDIVYAMTPFKLLMWPVGGWPLQVYNVYSLMRCVTVICGISIAMTLPSIEIYLGCTDAAQNVEALMIMSCGLLCIIKMIWFRIYANNLIKIYKCATNDYLTIENAEQRAIMLRHAFIGRTLMCTIISIIVFDCLMYSLMPILHLLRKNQINETHEDVEFKYIIPSRCTFEYLNISKNMYIFNHIMELIIMFFMIPGNYGNDSLFLHMALHICGQVKILKSKVINLDLAGPQIQNRFNALIHRHCHLMEMTKMLAEASSFILLIQLFLSSLLLCILGFLFIIALKDNDSEMTTKSFVAINGFLVQVMLYCVIGDYLKSQMEEVGAFIYQSAWYNLPAKLMKNLTLLIMRSQFPVQLQAGNFIVVNLQTYMSILKTSISYLSVLRVMVEK